VLTPAHNIFRPPQSEPVRPIDPTAWVQHTNAARGLDALMIGFFFKYFFKFFLGLEVCVAGLG